MSNNVVVFKPIDKTDLPELSVSHLRMSRDVEKHLSSEYEIEIALVYIVDNIPFIQNLASMIKEPEDLAVFFDTCSEACRQDAPKVTAKIKRDYAKAIKK